MSFKPKKEFVYMNDKEIQGKLVNIINTGDEAVLSQMNDQLQGKDTVIRLDNEAILKLHQNDSFNNTLQIDEDEVVYMDGVEELSNDYVSQ